ncbi:MAG TPA: patatin-like phospholipase family protein [Blastocatellia bacterium]
MLPAADSSQPLQLAQVLEEEYEALHGDLPADYDRDQPDQPERLANIWSLIHKQEQTALCISGGGIRSATFALGVLQGLARIGLLDKFEYLSTVSGGGYIGGWLSAWIHRHPQAEAGVASELKDKPPNQLQPEPKPVTHLRDYSNYLSPKLGLLSADTWTLVAIYVRNLTLNWLVLLPLLAAVIAAPRVYASVIHLIKDGDLEDGVVLTILLVAGGVLGAVAIAYVGFNRPSAANRNNTEKTFIWWHLLPLIFSGIFLTCYWACYATTHEKRHLGLLAFLGFGAVLNILGLILWIRSGRSRSSRPERPGEKKAKPGSPNTLRRIALELVAAFLSGLAGGLSTWLLFSESNFFFHPKEHGGVYLKFAVYVCFAVPALLAIYFLSSVLFTGLVSFLTDDEDREWLARSDAWTLISILLWVSITSLAIFGPIILERLTAWVGSIGGIAGLITILLGNNSSTSASKTDSDDSSRSLKSMVSDRLLSLAAPAFTAFVLILLSVGVTLLIQLILGEHLLDRTSHGMEALKWHVTEDGYQAPISGDVLGHYAVVLWAPWWLTGGLMLALLGLSAFVSLFVNINRFSLHAMYRNRLIRAYLGASHVYRAPNRFTGFDPTDNLPMYYMWPENEAGKKRKRLLHVVNMTLNLVAGKNLAWQQRKAESFTSSSLHSGCYRVGYRRSSEYGGDDGISLGTAVAISGAAASPNMGYHSSPVVTFLLTLFNARLGWWLGNPGTAGAQTYQKDGPTLSLAPLVEETLGLTDDTKPYIYLSDGGHFENLGLYEMILRRCALIVVIDGSQDENCAFQDLGNAVRKIRIDMGVPIEFEKGIRIYSRSADDKQREEGKYCAIATIGYSCVDRDAADGKLIYVKPAFYGSEPRDIYEYALSHKSFPHETTADQFFTEAQFESYRRLGEYEVERICQESVCGRDFIASDVKELLGKAREYLIEPAGTAPTLILTPMSDRGPQTWTAQPPQPIEPPKGDKEPADCD